MRSFRAAKRVRQTHPTGGDSMTEQSHEPACNINNIMAKYQKTGLVEHMNTYHGTYADVSGADFKEAQDLIAEQKSIFYELPAQVRAKFDHDPAKYLDLVMYDDGVEELANMLNPAKPETGTDDKKAPEPEETVSREENPVT